MAILHVAGVLCSVTVQSLYKFHKLRKEGASSMAQQVKVPATKTEHLRSVPGTHTLAGEHHSPRCGMGMRTAKGTQNDKRKKELE